MKKLLVALLLVASTTFAALPDYGQATLTPSSATWCKNLAAGANTAAISLTGNWTGPVTFLIGVGRLGAPIQQVPALTTNFSTQLESTTTSAGGVYVMPVSGFSQVCVTAPTAGSMTVYVELSEAPFASAFTTLLTSTVGTNGVGGTNPASEVILPPNPNNVLQRCNSVRQTLCR